MIKNYNINENFEEENLNNIEEYISSSSFS